MSSRPMLLSPQEEKKEIRLYRRVWPTAITEIAALLMIVGGVLLVGRFLHPSLGTTQRLLIGLGLALLPLALWGAISYRLEQNARRPRPRLLIVLMLSMLAANAVGVPLVNRFFAVDEWLPTTSGLTRIIGYTLTVGFVDEFLKFAVLRYSVWPTYFGSRIDGVAYSMAASIGYATVLSLNFVLGEAADPSAVALRVAGITMSQLAIGTIMGFLLAELKLGKPAVFWLPMGLGLAALLHGLYTAIRASLIVGGVNTTATGSVPAASLGVGLFLIFALFSSVSFLISSADERAKRSPEFSRR